jgi:2-Cys peroxiredoxin 5
MFATARRLPMARVANRRLFHASAPAFVNVGDNIPDVDLVEGSPGNTVNLAKELTGKGVIIGKYRYCSDSFKENIIDTGRRCPGSLLALML